MKYLYVIKFIAIVGSAFMATSTRAQTCSTVVPGSWTSPGTWSCTGGATAPPSGTFTGTINVTHSITLPDNSLIRITGLTTINITGGGSIDFGGGSTTRFEIVNANSTIVLSTISNVIKGGNGSGSSINVAGKSCSGPFNGSNEIKGSKTISFASPACTNFVLPVTLLSFTAKPEGERVQLAWATASEQDAERFIVERSTDLGEYVSVGQVAAKGTTNTRQNYGLTDMNPLPGINYYRLRQIDRNGTSQTFKPVSAIVDADEFVVVVYPNPADAGRIHLRLRNTADVAIRLMTLAGQPIDSKLESRFNETDLILQRPLPTGVYLLEVQTNGQKRIRKVMIP